MGECVKVFTLLSKFITVGTPDFICIIKTHNFFKGIGVALFIVTYVIVSRHGYGVHTPIKLNISKKAIIVSSFELCLFILWYC